MSELVEVRPIGYKPEGLINDPLADMIADEEAQAAEEREQEELRTLAKQHKAGKGRRLI